jgi:hypothetical protein
MIPESKWIDSGIKITESKWNQNGLIPESKYNASGIKIY